MVTMNGFNEPEIKNLENPRNDIYSVIWGARKRFLKKRKQKIYMAVYHEIAIKMIATNQRMLTKLIKVTSLRVSWELKFVV